MVTAAWDFPSLEIWDWRRSLAAPSPQFHPAQQRFPRRAPCDPRHELEDLLHKHRPAADTGREADADRGTARDQPKDQEHARWLGSAWLGYYRDVIHTRYTTNKN